jgi:hypothetical protein
LIRDGWFTGGDEDDGFGYAYGNGVGDLFSKASNLEQGNIEC